MTQERLNEITALKDEIEQIKRVLQADTYFYIGSPEQNRHDYYKLKGNLRDVIRPLLIGRLEQLENQFKEY